MAEEEAWSIHGEGEGEQEEAEVRRHKLLASGGAQRDLVHKGDRESPNKKKEKKHKKKHEQREDKTVTDQFMSTKLLRHFRDTLVPVIRETIEEANTGEIEDVVESTLGKIEYGIDGIEVAQALIPLQSLKVSFKNHKTSIQGDTVVRLPKSIQIKAEDIAIFLKPFSWYYKKDTFPKLKDKGKVAPTVKKVSITASVAVYLSERDAKEGEVERYPSAKLVSCNVGAKSLSIKISETKASVVYNIVIAAFKRSIKANLRKTLTQMMEEEVLSDKSIINLLCNAGLKVNKPKKGPFARRRKDRESGVGITARGEDEGGDDDDGWLIDNKADGEEDDDGDDEEEEVKEEKEVTKSKEKEKHELVERKNKKEKKHETRKNKEKEEQDHDDDGWFI
ncbi:Sas10 domain-containing protein [Balamuthia mandrillaris]